MSASTTTDLIKLTPTDALLERVHLVPDELVVRDQWIVWRLEDGAKIPRQAHQPHHRAKVNDSATWSTFAVALDSFAEHQSTDNQFTGIGYVFTEDDPFVGVDFDDCVDGDTIHPAAKHLIQQLGGYAEISPSQTGVKLWTKAALNLQTTGKAAHQTPWGGAVEVYHRGRWFAVTGWSLDR